MRWWEFLSFSQDLDNNYVYMIHYITHTLYHIYIISHIHYITHTLYHTYIISRIHYITHTLYHTYIISHPNDCKSSFVENPFINTHNNGCLQCTKSFVVFSALCQFGSMLQPCRPLKKLSTLPCLINTGVNTPQRCLIPWNFKRFNDFLLNLMKESNVYIYIVYHLYSIYS